MPHRSHASAPPQQFHFYRTRSSQWLWWTVRSAACRLAACMPWYRPLRCSWLRQHPDSSEASCCVPQRTPRSDGAGWESWAEVASAADRCQKGFRLQAPAVGPSCLNLRRAYLRLHGSRHAATRGVQMAAAALVRARRAAAAPARCEARRTSQAGCAAGSETRLAACGSAAASQGQSWMRGRRAGCCRFRWLLNAQELCMTSNDFWEQRLLEGRQG